MRVGTSFGAAGRLLPSPNPVLLGLPKAHALEPRATVPRPNIWCPRARKATGRSSRTEVEEGAAADPRPPKSLVPMLARPVTASSPLVDIVARDSGTWPCGEGSW